MGKPTKAMIRLAELEQELKGVQDELAVLELRERGLQRRSEKLGGEIVAACPHAEQEQSSMNYNGSYDEVARTFYTIKCKRCGKTMKSWNEAHNYYG